MLRWKNGKFSKTTDGIKPICGEIATGCAMRGRYNTDGNTSQQIEVLGDEISNAITTVQKDTLYWLWKKSRDFKKSLFFVFKICNFAVFFDIRQ